MMWKRTQWSVALACGAVAAGEAAAQCDPVTLGVQTGLVYEVAVDGASDTAYLATTRGGLQVVDVGDPTAPEVVEMRREFTRAFDVDLVGDVLYIADLFQGLVVLDVSEPRSPSAISTLPFDGRTGSLAVEAGMAHVSDGEVLHLVDVSDPSSPHALGSYVAPDTVGEAVVDGAVAYLPVYQDGVHVLDVSSPASPALLATIETPRSARGMRVEGERLYVTTREGVTIVDVSDPASPEVLATAPTVRSASDLEFAGGLAFVAVNNGSVRGRVLAMDLNDPNDPVELGRVSFEEGSAVEIVVVGGHAYISGSSGGMHVVDVSDPSDLRRAGGLVTGSGARDVEVHDGVAYVATGILASGLRTFDVSDPTFPRLLGAYPIGNSNMRFIEIDVDPAAGVAYVAGRRSGIHVFDVSDPADPQYLQRERVPHSATSLERVGDRLYMTSAEDVFYVMDVSNRRSPELLGSLEDVGEALTVSRGYAYVGGHDGLRIVDIADPTDPTLKGEWHLPGVDVHEIVMEGSFLFAAVEEHWRYRNRGGLYVFDISDPTDPRPVARADFPDASGEPYYSRSGANDLAVHEGIAYVRDRQQGLLLFDVANPLAPRPLRKVDDPELGPPDDFEDGLAYGAFGFGGLRVLDVSTCEGCAADMDGDGVADSGDLFLFLDRFEHGDLRVDLNGDGRLDLDDLFVFLDFFATGC